MKSSEHKEDKTDKFLKRILQAKEVHVPDGFSSIVLGHIRDEKIHKTLAKAEKVMILGGFVVLGTLALLLSFPEFMAGGSRQIREFWLVAPLLGGEAGASLLSFLGLGAVLVYTSYVLVDLLLVE
jgi:hypothetical protein